MLGYNTLAAMVFAGAARYRAPWDFLLAILAAFGPRRRGSASATKAPLRRRERAL